MRRFALACLAGLALLGGWLAAAYANNPQACFQRATKALERDDLERLQYDLLSLRAKPSFEAHASLLTGKLLLAEGRSDAALYALDVASKHVDTRVRALMLAGEALYAQGKFSDAGKAWARVVEVEPDNVEALRWLGIAYYDLGAMSEAVFYLEKAARLAPNDAGPHRLLGLIWRDLGNLIAARDSFRESLRRFPQQTDAELVRIELAECLHFLRDNEHSLSVLDQCRETPKVLAVKAECAYDLGHLDDARRFCQRSLALDGNRVNALIVQGRLYIEDGNPQQALQYLQRAAQIAPDSMEAHYDLALVYRRLGQVDRAEEEKRLTDELTEIREQYTTLSEKAANDPNDVEVRLRLGQLAGKLGLSHAARKWLRAAIYLDPENATARQALLKLLGQG